MRWEFITNKKGISETCIKCKKIYLNYYKCENCGIIICILCGILRQYRSKQDFTKKIEDIYPHFDVEIKGVKL